MELSDDTLLQRTVDADADAFALFFRRHEDVVKRYVLRRSATPDEVADAVADTFLVALRQAGRYRAELPSAEPWLIGIAHRVLAQQARGSRRRLRLLARVTATTPRFEDDEHERVCDALDARTRAAALAPAIAELPRRERDVLQLVALAELTPTEAAAALGVSPNAARVRLARARRRLALADDIVDPEVSCA